MKKIALFCSIITIGAATANSAYDTPASQGNREKMVTPPAPSPITASFDRALVDRVRQYLNSLRSLSADFVQSNQQGGIAKGTIVLARPGKMRVNYDSPSNLVIISDGQWVTTYDPKIGQSSSMPLENHPANLLLRQSIDFSEKVKILSTRQEHHTIAITMVMQDDPQGPQFTLYLQDDPLSLMKWSVRDAQGKETLFSLLNSRENGLIDLNQFKVK